MKRRLFAWLAALLLLSGASLAEGAITALEQLNNADVTIGVSTGSVSELSVMRELPKAKLAYYDDKFMGYSAVAQGKIDAFVYDLRQMELSIQNGQTGVRLLDETLEDTVRITVGISQVSKIPNLASRINQFIEELRARGTLDDMYDRWVVRGEETMPEIPLPTSPECRLTVGTSAVVPPYSYYSGTELNGYDIELARRFAAWLNAELELRVYDYGSIVQAAQSGRIDCIMADLQVSDERLDNFQFSQPLFEERQGVMVRDDAKASALPGSAGNGQPIESLAELEDKRIGVTTGSVQALLAEERFPDAQLFYFSTDVDMLNALRANKIDAFADAEALIRYMMADNPDLTYVDEYLGDTMRVGAVFPMTDRGRKLCDEYTAFVLEIRENGVYDELQDIWFGGDEARRVVPDLDHLPATNGAVRVAADTSMVPFVYVKDGKPVGVDIDTLVRFCKERGYGLELVQMDFPGIIPAVVTGKVDFACGGIAYTPERAESVLFSEPTYEGGSVLAVLKREAAASAAAGAPSFGEGIASSFDKTFLRENRWRLFARGILTTLVITVLSILSGTALGFLVFMLCRNGNRAANAVTGFCLWLVQGMPTVVLLMILYYIVFGNVAISGIPVAVIGFTLTFGSSVFGLMRMGVGAVDGGQYEAACALGYSNRRAFFRIILPQALPHVLPAYRGEIVGLIKATAVVGYIAVQDLTKMGDIVRSRTYEAFFPLIAVTVIYFALEGILRRLVGRVSIRFDPRRRRPEDILKGVKTHDPD